MGQGYYDHSLEFSSSNRINHHAHEFQKISDCLPDTHDVAADACLTDKKLYKF